MVESEFESRQLDVKVCKRRNIMFRADLFFIGLIDYSKHIAYPLES